MKKDDLYKEKLSSKKYDDNQEELGNTVEDSNEESFYNSNDHFIPFIKDELKDKNKKLKKRIIALMAISFIFFGAGAYFAYISYDKKIDLKKIFITHQKDTSSKQKEKKLKKEVIFAETFETINEKEFVNNLNNSLNNTCDIYVKMKYNTPPEEIKSKFIDICLKKDYAEALEILITQGITPNNKVIKSNEINRMLYTAVLNNRLKSINVLIKHGASLIAEQPNGMTLLHAAVLNNNLVLVKKLIELGLDVNKKNQSNKPPLYYALKNNYYDMVVFLVENGAVIEKDFYELPINRDVIYYIESDGRVKKDLNLSLEDKEWEEAYNYIKNGDLDSLILLTNQGKDLSKMCYKGEPAPCIAVSSGYKRILEYLINKYDCNELVDKTNGRNALHYAVIYKKPVLVEFLIKKGFDLNIQDKFGNTPLHYAAEIQDFSLIYNLLSNNANINSLNNKKRTPLFYAINAENIDILNYFKRYNADFNLQDIEGNTPLQYALSNFLFGSFKELIRQGADLKFVNKKGQTFLHLAVINNNIPVVDLLLDKGFSINQPDVDGNTSLHYIAKYASNTAMLNEFLKYKGTRKYSLEYKGNEYFNYIYDYQFDFTYKNKEGLNPLEICKPNCFLENESRFINDSETDFFIEWHKKNGNETYFKTKYLDEKAMARKANEKNNTNNTK